MAAWSCHSREGGDPVAPVLAIKPMQGFLDRPVEPDDDNRKGYSPPKKSHSSFMLSTITVMAISTASAVTQ